MTMAKVTRAQVLDNIIPGIAARIEANGGEFFWDGFLPAIRFEDGEEIQMDANYLINVFQRSDGETKLLQTIDSMMGVETNGVS